MDLTFLRYALFFATLLIAAGLALAESKDARKTLGLFFAVLLMFLILLAPREARAGGYEDYSDDDPCASGPLSYALYAPTVADADPVSLYAMYRGLGSLNCGWPAIWQDYAARGFDDGDLTRFFFDGTPVGVGYTPEEPAKVPLPGSMLMLLAGLASLTCIRKEAR